MTRVLMASVVWLMGTLAFAQAPGPMSRGHAHLDGIFACEKCHEGGTGVPDAKCLGCHDHRDLKVRIEQKKGFHADKEVRSEPCRVCHVEHRESRPGSGKGRRTTIDWRPFGGQRNFQHSRTGWALMGAHRFEKCDACHKRKSKRTGLTTYLGLRGECTACHETPHEFRDVRLSECQVCHGFSDRWVANVDATRFDHDATAFKLEGHHKKVKCEGCHEDTKTFRVPKFETCEGCHKDSHRSVISASRSCESCHRFSTKFEKTRFNHAAETKFALKGAHRRNRCQDCHKPGSGKSKPKTQCASCHDDVHKGRFGEETCEGCHLEKSWSAIRFDHNTKTKFELRGQHATTKCVNCHRDRPPNGFEKHETGDCASCHKHKRAHCGQFGLENCERCHIRPGARTLRFDHDLTGFRLVAGHAKPACSECHKPERLGRSAECRKAVKYTDLDAECGACHDDSHKGELGSKCSVCHTSGRPFDTVAFDHNADADFPLTGFHGVAPCAECHPKRRYKIGQQDCADCHKDDDIHDGGLGNACHKCHEPSGGAAKFDHDVHTSFDLRGVHRRIACARCHFLPAPAERKKSASEASGGPIDLLYRSDGAGCIDCHPDPHGVVPVNQVLDCEACHDFESWLTPSRNDYHERAGQSLTGAHTLLDCGLCHSSQRPMVGRAEQCGLCHVQDDMHYGSFGNDCGKCHEQLTWLPTSYTHMDTGYALAGVHRTLECRECHQAGNYFISNRCYGCHLDDYRRAPWHAPAPAAGDKLSLGGFGDRTYDCGECHNQFTFFKSTFFTPESEREP